MITDIIPTVIVFAMLALQAVLVFRLFGALRKSMEEKARLTRELESLKKEVDAAPGYVGCAASAAFFAGVITEYCGGPQYDGGFGVEKALSASDTFFLAFGPYSDRVRFRWKDGDEVETLSTVEFRFEDVRVHMMSPQGRSLRSFRQVVQRPSGCPYLSAMPEDHPELEIFFVDESAEPELKTVTVDVKPNTHQA